ncbi:MAG: hypothetical protein K6G26_07595 [Lachnospiraceae bacterium]|nr:hypothetical protein [Lachnospiraceae bacterium]
MKKKLLLLVFIVGLIVLGCSKTNLSSAKKTVNTIKEQVDEYNKYKDVEVHSEEEMREFALKCLEEKYGKKFLIDESYCEYEHFNGHEDKPMTLYARAYPECEKKETCGLFVEEPNIFKDNYFVNLYLPDIEDFIIPEMDKYDLKGELDIDYPLMAGTIGDSLSAKDIIYDTNTRIVFLQPVEKKDDIQEYITIVRKWLNFLYTCDYEWYFALTDKEDSYYQYIGISKGDLGYSSEKEWTDEDLLSIMEFCIESSEKDKKNYTVPAAISELDR